MWSANITKDILSERFHMNPLLKYDWSLAVDYRYSIQGVIYIFTILKLNYYYEVGYSDDVDNVMLMTL